MTARRAVVKTGILVMEVAPGGRHHRCPDNGAQVDLADCSVSADVGSTQLMTLWTDPDFDRKRAPEG